MPKINSIDRATSLFFFLIAVSFLSVNRVVAPNKIPTTVYFIPICTHLLTLLFFLILYKLWICGILICSNSHYFTTYAPYSGRNFFFFFFGGGGGGGSADFQLWTLIDSRPDESFIAVADQA